MATSLTPILTTLPTTDPGAGFSVFFWDSRYKFTAAGPSTSLGYSNYVGDIGTQTFELSGAYNGLRGAFLGVGFDVSGEFGTTNNYKTGALSAWDGSALSAREGLTNPEPNSITLRSGADLKWSVITRTPNLSTLSTPVTLHQTVSSLNDIEYKRCRVKLLNQGKLVRVEIKDSNGDYQTYLEQTLEPTATLANAVYNSVPSLPTTFNVGMAFANGKTASNCWVKNFSVYGDTVDDANATTILDTLTALTVVSPTSEG